MENYSFFKNTNKNVIIEHVLKKTQLEDILNLIGVEKLSLTQECFIHKLAEAIEFEEHDKKHAIAAMVCGYAIVRLSPIYTLMQVTKDYIEPLLNGTKFLFEKLKENASEKRVKLLDEAEQIAYRALTSQEFTSKVAYSRTKYTEDEVTIRVLRDCMFFFTSLSDSDLTTFLEDFHEINLRRQDRKCVSGSSYVVSENVVLFREKLYNRVATHIPYSKWGKRNAIISSHVQDSKRILNYTGGKF